MDIEKTDSRLMISISNARIDGSFFYSRTIAYQMLHELPDAEWFEVRGVSQYQLKGFIAQMKTLGISAGIYYLPFWLKIIHKYPLLQLVQMKWNPNIFFDVYLFGWLRAMSHLT